MNADDVRRVLLVRAFEEADPGGAVLSRRERDDAGSDAEARVGATGSKSAEPYLVERARLLLHRIENRVDGVSRALSLGRTDVPFRRLAPFVALIAGLATSALGTGRVVHLLQAPILVLIVVNLLVYVVLVLSAVGLLRKPVAAVRAPLVAMGARAVRAAAARLGKSKEGRGAVAGEAYRTFAGHWTRAASKALVARAARTLHLCAALLMVGAVVAMYVTGMAKEFKVAWESTFLGASQVEAFLRVVLAPGLALLDGGLDPVEPLRREVNPDGKAAARWAHLYAISAVAWVVLPRLALAWWAGLRGRRHESHMPLDTGEPYYRRLLARGRGGATHVLVLPYSHKPAARVLDRLGALLAQVFGGRAVVSTSAPTDYGDAPAETSDGASLVAVLNLAQTPEVEVHGEFLQRIRDRVSGDARLLVLVDASGYRERLGGGDEAARRVRERRVTWSRVVADVGLRAVHVDLGGEPGDDELADVVAGLWPSDAKG